MAIKDVYIISLGCPRNLVDSEVLAGAFRKKNFRILQNPKKGCLAVVNTCAFIEDARKESIDIILEMAELKKSAKLANLVVSGCLAQRYRKELMDEIPEIDAVFGADAFAKIPEHAAKIFNGEKITLINNRPRFLYNHESARSIFTPRHSVYIKIQEGCMNLCSYCIIPKIRGPYRSRRTESVLKEAESLKGKDAREINLIGQDTTLYGVDLYGKKKLADLVKKVSAIMQNGWIRILYTHPAHYTKSLIDAVKRERPVCKYLDLPIQHINDGILKRMNRRVTKKSIINLIGKLRKEVPGLAIRSSLIVGFPGETEKEFRELLEFVKEVRFERLGAFTYSREEGTLAFSYPGQVTEKEKETRLKRIMKIQTDISSENNKKYLDKTIKVLIDAKDRSAPGQYLGRTEHDAPEVDGTVYVRSPKPLKTGDFVKVKIEDTLEYDLAGSAI